MIQFPKKFRDLPFIFAGNNWHMKRSLLYMGSGGQKNLSTLFDGEASVSYIDPDSVRDLGVPVRLGRVRQLHRINEGSIVEINSAITVDFYINDILLSDEFFIVPGLGEEAVIGAATLRKWRIKLDFENDQVIVDPKVEKQRI